MTDPPITDIWFRTDKGLMELGLLLGLGGLFYDYENYWEWVIGSYGNLELDITRTHKLDPNSTDTRIFIWKGGDFFPDQILEELAGKLIDIGISPVYMGRWVYQTGNEFEKIIQKEARANKET